MQRALRTTKLHWVFSLAACAIAAAWLFSVPLTSKFVTLLFRYRTLDIYVMKGSLCFEVDDTGPPRNASLSVVPGFAMQRAVREPQLWDWGIRRPFAGTERSLHSQFTLIVIPLWLPFVLSALAASVLWLRRRPASPDHCPHCNYNLTKNLSGRCPECGTPISSSKRPRPLPDA